MLTDVLKTHRLCIIRICVLYCRSNNIVKSFYFVFLVFKKADYDDNLVKNL